MPTLDLKLTYLKLPCGLLSLAKFCRYSVLTSFTEYDYFDRTMLEKN